MHGITVSAFCSVSLTPPLILVCIEKTTGSHYSLNDSGTFAVNILSAEQDIISERFSIPFGNKFDGVEIREGINGIPVLADALVSLECRLQHAYDGGDHTIFVGLVEEVSITDGSPLVYFHGNYRHLLET